MTTARRRNARISSRSIGRRGEKRATASAALEIGPLVFGPSDRLLTCVEPAGDPFVRVAEDLRLGAPLAVIAQLAPMPAAGTVNLPEQLARLRLPGSRWFQVGE